jgi:hypothetical protein
METAARSRAWRAVLVLCGLVLLGSAAELRAGTLLSPGAGVLVRKSAEPFGVFAFAISAGSLQQKWLALRSRLDDDMVQLALCDGDRDNCASPAALKLLAIVDQARSREGRALLGETNRAINLAIRAADDGSEDVWSSPLATFAPGIARTTPLPSSPPLSSRASPLKISASSSCATSGPVKSMRLSLHGSTATG